MKNNNLNLLASLATFSVNAEEPADQLTAEDVESRLEGLGLDMMKLDAAIVRKLKKLRAQLDSDQGQGKWAFGQRSQRDLLVTGKSEAHDDVEDPLETDERSEDSGQ
ncbi:MAG: hypothetical protein KJZ62_07950 [Fimbriimonadaceae bacterium]|nr:hypothetical protein [Fimbriimonadaceae bacterium]QOJ10599.1 MAG: hypothetical protein HRU74_00470 [Chthonomonadaceae bacterium]